MARCKAKTKSGDQCRNNAIRGTRYCYITSHGSFAEPLYRRFLNFLGNHLLLTLIGLALTGFGLFLHYREKKLTSVSGIVTGAQPASEKYLSIGAARISIDAPDGVFVREGNVPIVSVKLKGNKLYVSTLIRDAQGRLMAELKDNEWSLNKNAIYDRNYNDQALEVKDNHGNIVLQVVDFGDTIHLAGLFHCQNGAVTVLAPVDEHSGAVDFLFPGQEAHYQIQSICGYPSDRHFGSCPGIESLKRVVQNGEGCAVRLGGRPVGLCEKQGRIIIGDCTK